MSTAYKYELPRISEALLFPLPYRVNSFKVLHPPICLFLSAPKSACFDYTFAPILEEDKLVICHKCGYTAPS